MNMIEKVARALCKRRNTGQCAAICLSHFSLNNICPEVLTVWREDAKASIAAMREPSEEMLEAAYKTNGNIGAGPFEPDDFSPDTIWYAMIDAALKEE